MYGSLTKIYPEILLWFHDHTIRRREVTVDFLLPSMNKGVGVRYYDIPVYRWNLGNHFSN
jgi:hypothetical protein